LELLASLYPLLAQTTAPTTSGPAAPSGIFSSPLVPLMVGILILWFFVFRAKNKQERSRTDMMSKLKPGERVQTIGGIIGVITQVSDNVITVKVDETNNVKIKFSRSAIHRVLEEEKTEPK
jgi:preprotein translocase subunit YajC